MLRREILRRRVRRLRAVKSTSHSGRNTFKLNAHILRSRFIKSDRDAFGERVFVYCVPRYRRAWKIPSAVSVLDFTMFLFTA
jgi:hypothetical protein